MCDFNPGQARGQAARGHALGTFAGWLASYCAECGTVGHGVVAILSLFLKTPTSLPTTEK